MIIDSLKKRLLDTGYFIDNFYFEKYILLVTANASNNHATQYTESHHILQFSYFARLLAANTTKEKIKLRRECSKTGTDTYNLITKNNIVYLSFYNHCLAHYYLYFCTNGALKYDNEQAVIKMTGRNLNLRNCTEQDVINVIKLVSQIKEDPSSQSFKSNLINKVIIDNYIIGGYELCQKKLYEQYNIYYSKNNIKARAKKLNIKAQRYTPAWNEAEIKILKNNYSVYGYKKCMELLPGRTKYAIQARAKYLGLVAPGKSKKNSVWTLEEDNILYMYYPLGGSKLCKQYLTNRSATAIKSRANNHLHIYKIKKYKNYGNREE